jgi:hypothetical protein
MTVKGEGFQYVFNYFCNRPTRYLAWTVLCVTLSAWGQVDPASHHPPRSDKGHPGLKIEFEPAPWTGPSGLRLCSGPCSASGVAASKDLPEEPQSYKQRFDLDLGKSGPFSIRFSESRFKMEMNF